MTTYYYHQFRLSSSLIFLILIQTLLPAFGQLGKLPDPGNEFLLQDVSEDIYGEKAMIEYAARHITLSKEGFEEFTTLSDRKGNEILEHAVSGRFGYLHILVQQDITDRKVKRAIAHALKSLGDIEGIIFDLRFNPANTNSQQDWFSFLNEEMLQKPGVLISANSFLLPADWDLLLPWQMSPFQTEDIVSTRAVFAENPVAYTEIKDQIILIGLRKLRQPQSLKNFGVIWSR